jgi:Na+/melibiose symporter-like transporter
MEDRTMDNATPVPALSFRARLFYGLGSVGTGLYFSVPGILLLFYMTDTLAVESSLAALAIFLPKFVGALADPLAGYWSDGTRSRHGRRLPWMAGGGALIVVCLWLLFAVPAELTGTGAFMYILVVYMLSSLGYSAYAVPYLAIPAEVTSDPVERSKLISMRMILTMVGVMAGSAVAPWALEYFGGGRTGYRHMGVMIAVVAILAFLAAGRFASVYSRELIPARSSAGFRRQIARVFGNLNFNILVLIFILQTISTSGFSALLPYVVTRQWGGSESMVGLLMLCFLSSSMVGMIAWSAIAARLGKRPTLIVAILGFTLVIAVFLFIDPVPGVGLLCALFAVAGLVFSGTQLLPFAMVADEIYESGLRSGSRNEGVFTGIWTSCEKLGLSLGAPIAALVLALAGYVESSGAEAVQSPATIREIYRGFIGIPIAAQCLSIGLLLVQSQIRRRAVTAAVTGRA